MKKILFLIGMCLVMGLFTVQLNAQKTSPKTIQGWATGTYYGPVFCDGEMVDYLEGGTLRIHYVVKYKDGMFQWEIDQLKGQVTSVTGETFRIRETDHTYFKDHWYVTWHYNLIGDQGTHYTGTLTWSYFDQEYIIGNTTCH